MTAGRKSERRRIGMRKKKKGNEIKLDTYSLAFAILTDCFCHVRFEADFNSIFDNCLKKIKSD